MKKIYSTPSVKEIKLKLERMIAESYTVDGNDGANGGSTKGKEEDIDFGF